MKTQFIRAYWLTCVLLTAIVPAASATTIVMPTDEQLVRKSPVIVRGVVLSSNPIDHSGAVWTETVLQVDEVLKGSVPSTLTIREIGGILGDRITKIFGSPEYSAGEHVLAFLTPTPRGDYQTVDLFVGKFTEAKMLNGGRLWMRNGDAANVTLLDSNFHPIASPTSQRDAVKFEQFVADRVSGVEGAQNYGLENPVLEPVPAAGRLQIAPNFTLIAEPTVYRWSSFDSGGSASWRAYGSQPGYSGGGINEFQTAMSQWTSYSAAKIRYSYAGTFSGPPAGNSTPNGINEVDFNDPTSEISGSWNPATGGVVGQGGFNGTAGATNWTAPFTADSTHVQQTYRATTITEGNLVIQDGVSPAAGVNSTILAEIIAHELGHTLGFGHSADPTALMYATVTNLGPQLQADDQVAARWLYPSGTSTPPPPPTSSVPAAPTGLTVTATSATTAALKWTDNSSSESGFHIYFANGSSGGSFSNIGDVAAGAQSATINGLAAGTFRFYVTAFNTSGESAASNTAILTIGTTTQPVSAAFAVSPGTTGTAGVTTFQFTDQSTGPVVSRTWNFGDGVTSTAVAPTHLYVGGGTYTVLLTVRDSAGNQSQASRAITITAPLPPLEASFSFSPSNPVAGDTVSFVDQSTGGVTSWFWNFGDGSTSAQQNPAKTYANAGTYTVSLTVYRNSDTSVTSKTVSVASKAPATPPPGTFTSLVPVTAQNNGAGGSIWRTEFSIFNAGSETASVNLTFVPGAGTVAQTRSISVLPRETRTYANVLLDVFGIANGAGGVSIGATSASTTPDLRISSRTFAATPTGTYGQSVPDVPSSDLQTTSYMTGIISNADFRTNIGITNKSANSVATTLVLVDGNGRIVQTASVSVAPNSFQQASLGAYFPVTAAGSYPVLSLRVSTGARDAVSVYASVVDNKTQDPVYIQAAPPATAPMTLPVVARANGANGTFWRSDITVFNPGTAGENVNLTFDSSSGTRTRSLYVAPGSAVVLPDFVGSFGFSAASGPADVTWSGANAPVVTSRTYTTATNGGTYGQSVDIAGDFGSRQYVTGLRSDFNFRTNVGFVNNGAAAIPVHAVVLSSIGTVLGALNLTVGPHSLVQVPLGAIASGIDAASIGTCTLQANTDGATTLFVYGSVIDNSTGDPVFFAGK